MKRFLMFLVIAIAVTSLGLSIYYFAKDNEVIFINNTQISINAGDTFKADDLLTFQNASKYTKVDYSGIKDDSVLTYNKNEGYYAAVKGGETDIVITTTNRAYSNLVIKVIVRDGSEEFPYIIDSEEELRAIGVEKEGNKFTASSHYELGKSIILTEKWTPIESFTGSINGAGYTISNIDISAYTTEEINATKIDNNGTSVDTAKTTAYNAYNEMLKALNNSGFVGKLDVDTVNGNVGKIYNLNLKNVNINCSAKNVGAIAGVSYGSIVNCEVSTDSYIKYHNVEGKVGAEEVIYNNIQTDAQSANLGGVVGSAVGIEIVVNGVTKTFVSVIERVACHARIFVNTKQSAGGIVGLNKSASVTESYFDGYAISTTAGLTFGGIVGENTADTTVSESTIIDNYAMVKTLDDLPIGVVGGIAYINTPTLDEEYKEHHIFGNYFTAVRIYSEDTTYVERNIDCFGKVDSEEEYAKNSAMVTATQLKDTNTFVTYKQVVDGQDYIRMWNFEDVWYMDENAPKLNKEANSGSIYEIDYSSVKGNNTISSSDSTQDIYNKLAAGSGSYNIAADIDMKGYVWNPIARYSGTLTGNKISDGHGGTRNPIMSNIIIEVPAGKVDSGLFGKLTKDAFIAGITFKNVTIKPAANNVDKSASYVGTLAGYSEGSYIYDVSIINTTVVDLNMVGFGGLVGYCDHYKNTYIGLNSVDGVIFTASYAQLAGGITAVNKTSISGSETKYTTTNNISVYANKIGGIAANNEGGHIQYVKGNVNCTLTSDNRKIYNNYNSEGGVIIVAGVVAYNYFNSTVIGAEGSGTICVDTAKGYVVDLAGVVGYNKGNVWDTSAKNLNIVANNAHAVFAGGIAGRSLGQIDVAYVDSTVSITTSTAAIAQNDESYVGGVAGAVFNSVWNLRVGSVSNAIVKAENLQGFFVGGLVGYSYGSVVRSYVEGTKITGFFAGGLAAIIHNVTQDGKVVKSYDGNLSGEFKYNYAIVSIENTNSTVDVSNFTQSDIYSAVAKFEKSASAGIAVIVMYNSVVDNCYTVVNYIGEGIKAPTTLSRACGSSDVDVRKAAASGVIKNTIYTSEQTNVVYKGKGFSEGGAFVSETDLRPVEGSMYKVFTNNGFDTSVWAAEVGELPTIVGLDNLVSSSILK